MKGKDIKWEEKRDAGLGMNLLTSEEFRQNISPGLYRLEVSTPVNNGKYLLKIGTNDQKQGYLEDLRGVYDIRKFFGLSTAGMIQSSLVYYPLLILFVLSLFYLTFKYRDKITKAHA
jgi:hypothetical protein